MCLSGMLLNGKRWKIGHIGYRRSLNDSSIINPKCSLWCRKVVSLQKFTEENPLIMKGNWQPPITLSLPLIPGSSKCVLFLIRMLSTEFSPKMVYRGLRSIYLGRGGEGEGGRRNERVKRETQWYWFETLKCQIWVLLLLVGSRGSKLLLQRSKYEATFWSLNENSPLFECVNRWHSWVNTEGILNECVKALC